MTDLMTDCKTDPRCNVRAVLHPCDVFLGKTHAVFFLRKNSAVWRFQTYASFVKKNKSDSSVS